MSFRNALDHVPYFRATSKKRLLRWTYHRRADLIVAAVAIVLALIHRY